MEVTARSVGVQHAVSRLPQHHICQRSTDCQKAWRRCCTDTAAGLPAFPRSGSAGALTCFEVAWLSVGSRQICEAKAGSVFKRIFFPHLKSSFMISGAGGAQGGGVLHFWISEEETESTLQRDGKWSWAGFCLLELVQPQQLCSLYCQEMSIVHVPWCCEETADFSGRGNRELNPIARVCCCCQSIRRSRDPSDRSQGRYRSAWMLSLGTYPLCQSAVTVLHSVIRCIKAQCSLKFRFLSLFLSETFVIFDFCILAILFFMSSSRKALLLLSPLLYVGCSSCFRNPVLPFLLILLTSTD